MSCKSAIMLVNSGSNAVTEGNAIPTGNIARRFGGNVVQSGSGLALLERGYYLVQATFTVVPSAVGVVGISVYLNGSASANIGDAVQTYAATAAEPVNLTVVTLVRNCSCEQQTFVEFILSNSSGTVTQSNIVVTKL